MALHYNSSCEVLLPKSVKYKTFNGIMREVNLEKRFQMVNDEMMELSNSLNMVKLIHKHLKTFIRARFVAESFTNHNKHFIYIFIYIV